MASTLRRRVEKRMGRRVGGIHMRQDNSYRGAECLFEQTNEALTPIIVGLSPTEEDAILSVCGSGDQSFALLESGARIWAVDYTPTQIEYAKHRAELLRMGRYADFLTVGRRSLNGWILDYFSEEGRLDRIRENIDNISFHKADIFALKGRLDTDYTKIYLSNAYGYQNAYKYRKRQHGHRDAHDIADRLRERGTLYAARAISGFASCCDVSEDTRLSWKVQAMEEGGTRWWRPTVYRSTKE